MNIASLRQLLAYINISSTDLEIVHSRLYFADRSRRCHPVSSFLNFDLLQSHYYFLIKCSSTLLSGF